MITNKEVRISVNKTLTKKLIYVVAALTLLAMLIPAMAVPVFADPPAITLQLAAPLAPDAGYNVRGSTVLASLPQNVTGNWSLIQTPGVAQIDTTPVTEQNSVLVTGTLGEVTIKAVTASGNATKDKKWGLIKRTDITTDPTGGGSAVTWNESGKRWEAGPVTITDTVTGTFMGGTVDHAMQGVLLDWYLFPASLNVDLSAGEYNDYTIGTTNYVGLDNRMKNYLANNKTNQVSFDQWTVPPVPSQKAVQTKLGVSDQDGKMSVNLYARGEEAVKIVIIPHYPGNPQIMLTPEVATWAFYTTENEVVPQVRWAGEKIVLEKNFGTTFRNYWVKFSLQNQSVGALEGIDGDGESDSAGAVWTQVDSHGFASCILVSSDAGVANVTAGLYNTRYGILVDGLENQHFFTVFFLKLESISLGDVNGKRVGENNAHDSGVWTPPNPWDNASDATTQSLNVSQDALLRARVKGWFTSNNPSWRTVRYVDPYNSTVDPANNTPGSLLLPAGRWVLPDDWQYLAGPNWKVSRLHWDIMCNPDGTVTASNELGPYMKGTTPISSSPVIGPFSPGLEVMTPSGWSLTETVSDSLRITGAGIETILSDPDLTNLNSWDAPMPPAKVIFQIQPNTSPAAVAGYFKSAMKTDIYYLGTVNAVTGAVPNKLYTNPFYQALIPAHEAIPCFINNGGYDWNSFLVSYGPYKFWTMINQSAYKPLVATVDPAGHPTVAEVYSDNHGEAMIWLNGNWHLDLSTHISEGLGADVPINTLVGTTTVQATADYPYSRLHSVLQSNTDTKTWFWGGQILGTDAHTFAHPSGVTPVSTSRADTRMVLSVGTWDAATVTGSGDNMAAKSANKMVWVWVTDRDGSRKGVKGAKVTWDLSLTGMATIATTDGPISQFNTITGNITLKDGFLSDTNGSCIDVYRLKGVSYLRAPTSYETTLFNKFWGPSGTSAIKADPANYVVAGIKVYSGNGLNGQTNVTIKIYSHDFDTQVNQDAAYVQYETNLNFFTDVDALDDTIRAGDANCDGVVNMGDVTAVERMILGYSAVTSNAILNNDGTVDMGTVVKIERTILGLK